LSQELGRLQDLLSRRSAEFKATTQPIDLDAIQSLLPNNAALIEYARYQAVDFTLTPEQQWGDDRYVAYVLTSNGDIQAVDLGATADIDLLIADLNVALQNPNVGLEQVKEAAHALESVVLAPLRPSLASADHWLISPDGALNLVPFEALVDKNGQFLVDQITTTYLTSGRDLLRLQVPSPAQQPPLLLADPIFNQPGQEPVIAQTPTTRSTSFADVRQALIPSLPETLVEAEAIQAMLPQAQLLVGAEATEAAIKQVQRPSILHIATHGFFLGANPDETPSIDNALLRSGLLLSGFRLGQSGGTEDGMLTALEVAGLDLFGTQLVVLSACDTGQGDTTVGEGVYGLRRALVLAGSQSQVISLWQVQDDTTKDLMVDFYTRLMDGEGRSEALRNARRAMLLDEQTAHPYYWASFIQSGDWRPITVD
jgi:CHAT domain-containing protein